MPAVTVGTLYLRAGRTQRKPHVQTDISSHGEIKVESKMHYSESSSEKTVIPPNSYSNQYQECSRLNCSLLDDAESDLRFNDGEEEEGGVGIRRQCIEPLRITSGDDGSSRFPGLLVGGCCSVPDGTTVVSFTVGLPFGGLDDAVPEGVGHPSGLVHGRGVAVAVPFDGAPFSAGPELGVAVDLEPVWVDVGLGVVVEEPCSPLPAAGGFSEGGGV